MSSSHVQWDMWEPVTSDAKTMRLPVYGGWLVKVIEDVMEVANATQINVSLQNFGEVPHNHGYNPQTMFTGFRHTITFVADPDHSWPTQQQINNLANKLTKKDDLPF